MIIWLLAAALGPVEVGCATCHPAERVQLERSVHYREGIGCEDCHGGNPEALSVEASHRGNYRGVPSRREIPKHCASCHSDPKRMRPYNLPVDQLALYRISEHGRVLARGDANVAVCTDCHGVHDIRAKSDPESPVYPANVPATCASCHADEGLMSRYGLPATNVEQYRASVHGKALLEQGNPNAPSCARCHGVHGASPPGIGDVDKVCGQCHGSARDFYVGSTHKAAMDAAGLPECASCHGSHGIGPAGSELADKVCHECHPSGSEEAGIGDKLLTLQTGAIQEIQRAEELIDQAEGIPIDVEDYRARLEMAKTHLQEAYPAMHSLDIEKVSPFTLSARSEAEDIQREIYEKLSDIRIRRLGLVVFWFYILLTVAILARMKRRRARA